MKQIKIHIVEDDVIIAEDLKSTLEEYGYKVIGISGRGKEAYNTIRDSATDLVFIDVKLEGDMDGIELGQKLQKIDIPFIYLTAYSNAFSRAKETSPYGYLLKPFNKHKLKFTIEIALERYKAEQKERQQELKYKTLFENTGTAVFHCTTKGDLIKCNKAAADLLQIPQSKLIDNYRMQNFIPQDEHGRFMQFLKGDSSTFGNKEFHLIGRNNTNIDMHFRKKSFPNDNSLIISAIDLSKLKTAERALEWEKNLFESLLNNTSQNIFIKDQKHEYIQINQSYAEFLGIDTPSEAIGRTDYDFYPEQYAQKWEKEENQILNNGEHIQREESITWKNDKKVHQLIDKLPITNPKGKILGILGLAKDITAKVQNKRKLKEAKQKAEKANQAKSRFLANISHEIRTPMNAIIGFSELMESIVEKEEAQEYLDSIQTSGQTLLNLIDDLLELSTIEVSDVEISESPTEINEVLREVEEIFNLEVADKNIALILDPASIPTLVIDQKRIKQILLNLVSNAIKFTEEGYIKFGVDIEDVREENNEKIGQVCFYVEDTGIGIPEDQQKEIFKSFAQKEGQDDGKYGGTGLGLAICKKIVDKLDGRLKVKSKEGEGSTFSFILKNVKLIDKPSDNKIDRNEEQPQELHFDTNILVCDKNLSRRSLIQDFLRSLGFSSSSITATEDLKNIVKREKVDLVLYSIDTLPDISQELADAIRLPPIVGITEDNTNIEKSNNIINTYLERPITKDKLENITSSYVTQEEQNKKYRENEEWGYLKKTDQQKLAQTINKLELKYVPKVKENASNLIIDEILETANSIENHISDHEIPLLQDWAKNIKKNAKEYEIEKVEQLLKMFPQKVHKIQKYLNESRK